jgi:O-antigen/teichoic acid export membrane protein
VTESGEIHERARRSLWLVSGGQALVALLGFASGVVLARRLSPADFGLFAISTFVVVLVGLVVDLGLHAGLIQRRAEVTTHELRAAFTVQQIAATVAMIVVWQAAGLLPTIYPDSSRDLVTLVRIMAADLYLLAWCRPGEALLERSLQYHRLVPIDIAGSCVYAIVAIVLAENGVGVLSFGIAWVSSSVCRVILISRAAPWPVGFASDWKVARSILRVGVPLQGSRVIAQAQYWVTPTVVAATIGPAAAGLLQWAAGNGRKPLDVLEQLARVSLPHFSRLQHDERELDVAISRYVSGFTLVSAYWFVLVAVAGRDLVRFVYTDRWLPAVPALVLFAAVGVIVAVRAVTTTALAGLGRTMLIGRVAVVSAVVTVIASVALVPVLGALGVPLGQLFGAAVAMPRLIAGLGNVAARGLLRATASSLGPAIASAAAGLLVRMSPLPFAERGLITAVLMTVVYVVVVWFGGPPWVRALVRERGTVAVARNAA